jgi:hypothetical protein
MVTAPLTCAVPDCGERRVPKFLGWHGDDMITSAYCEDHGPTTRLRHCPECGQVKSSSRAWPDGIPPAGVVNGKVGTLTVT